MKERETVNNIYLTGMPGSGKSALGKEASRELNKEFIDMDSLIENKAGKSINEIFNEEGEASFRALEKEVLKNVSECSGLLVSTGGGIILDPENVQRMKESGTVILIDRPLELLVKYIDIRKRPLLKNGKEEIRNLYQKRYDLYRKSADIVLINDNGMEKALEKLLQYIKEN